jgi:hypothetical protein
MARLLAVVVGGDRYSNGLTMANLIEQLTIGVQDYTTITKVG